jgi:O-antigen/teichoic acid export membrane protein
MAGYGGVMSAFLNGTKTLRKQVVFYAIASVASLILKTILVLKWGAAGAVWATVIGYSVFYALPAYRLAQRTLQEGKLRNDIKNRRYCCKQNIDFLHCRLMLEEA